MYMAAECECDGVVSHDGFCEGYLGLCDSCGIFGKASLMTGWGVKTDFISGSLLSAFLSAGLEGDDFIMALAQLRNEEPVVDALVFVVNPNSLAAIV